MKFLNPAGLWFLLGVPVLIIIYIIKSPHDDKPVSSTYIWKLSSRFMKRKLPLNRLRKILGFIFQLALIVGAALLSARPVKVIGVRTNYVLIFDASASMRMKDSTGASRFERAIPLAKEYAGETENNNQISIISASDDASLILSSSSDADEIKLALSGISCGFGGCNLKSAYEMAADITATSANSQIVLFTDKDYNPMAEEDISEALENGTSAEKLDSKVSLPANTTLVNMASPENEWNAIVKSLTYEKIESPFESEGEGTGAAKGFTFTGEIACEGRDGLFSCAFMLDGSPVDARTVECPKGETVTLTFTTKAETFENAELVINADDGLDIDNSFGVFKHEERILKILVCGPSPFYTVSALKTLDNIELTERIPEEFDWRNDVYYDLYIFDGFTPNHYPQDGSIIYIDCDELSSGVSAGEPADVPAALKLAPNYSGSYFNNLILKGTMVDGYRPLSITSDWEKLFTCGGKTVIAFKHLSAGLCETVISFDFHNSNLPMMTDFPLIMKDLVAMSTTDMLETNFVTVGSPVVVNAKFNTTKIIISDADEQDTSLTFDKGFGTFIPEKSGLYTVTRYGKYSFQKDISGFFAGVPKTEYDDTPLKELPEITLQNDKIQTEDATSDLRTLIALILLALLLLEWGLYYYEQY